jgi:DNA-directed RNA polymerase subunit E'/Rpb7
MSFDKTKPMQKRITQKALLDFKILQKQWSISKSTTPSLCTNQKVRFFILKQSTSSKESNDYKNTRFELTDQKI